MTQLEEEKKEEQYTTSQQSAAYKEFVSLSHHIASETKPWFVRVFIIPIVIVALVFGLSVVVMYLWNALLPDILGVSAITYWQAIGILVLCKILFGSFNHHNRHSKFERHYNRRKKLREIWTEMTPEEKLRIKQELKKEWKDLSAEQKLRKKEVWKQEWEQVCSKIKEQEKKLNDKWNLTTEEKRIMKEEWKKMTPQEKQKKKEK